MASYTVQQGDHLSGIAAKFGFRDFNTIWNHPSNAGLKQKRQDAHVLLPGDTIFVPDKGEKTVQAATGSVHNYKLKSKPLMLRLGLQDFDGQPIANADCELEIEGKTLKLKSNAKGLIETPVDPTARKGTLRVPTLQLEYPVMIGHLDPLEEDSGWQARLINLGYHAGAVGDPDQEQLGYAIEEFQCDQKLKVTGQLDAATKAKLKEIHGV